MDVKSVDGQANDAVYDSPCGACDAEVRSRWRVITKHRDIPWDDLDFIHACSYSHAQIGVDRENNRNPGQ